MALRHYLAAGHPAEENGLYDVNNMWKASRIKWPSNLFVLACREGYADIVKKILDSNTIALDLILSCDSATDHICYIITRRIINRGLVVACSKWVNIVLMLIEYRDFLSKYSGKLANNTYPNTFNNGLAEACRGGHMDIIQLMISRGATNWQTGLEKACGKGHIEIAKLMISRGATDYNKGMLYACRGGNMEIVRLMISLGATCWNKALSCACYGGNINLIRFLIKHGARNWQAGLNGACYGGHKKIVELMIQYGATGWNDALLFACYEGCLEIVELMISHGATDWKSGLIGACAGGHEEIVELMISRGATPYDGFNNAYRNGNRNILRRIITSSMEHRNDMMLYCGAYGYVDMVKLLLQLGIDINQGYQVGYISKYPEVLYSVAEYDSRLDDPYLLMFIRDTI